MDLLMHHEVESGLSSLNINLGTSGRDGGEELKSLSSTAMTTKSLVETMRAEIRLENEKMQDATKSLMEDEDDGTPNKSVDILGKGPPAPSLPLHTEELVKSVPGAEVRQVQETSVLLPNQRPLAGERKYSAPEIGILERQQVSGIGSSSNIIGSTAPVPLSSTSSPVASYRARSFSLRQASVDSIGDSSDLGSPDGSSSLPFLQRAMSCDSVCSDTSVVLGDLDAPHITGYLCVGLEYDR